MLVVHVSISNLHVSISDLPVSESPFRPNCIGKGSYSAKILQSQVQVNVLESEISRHF